MVHGRVSRATPPTKVLAGMLAVAALLLGTVAGAGRAGADTGPSVTATPGSDLPAVDAEVTVVGSGFSGNPIYVALGPAGVTDVAGWNMKADLFNGARQVSSFTDGSFTQVLTVDAVFSSGGTEVDCRVVECGIYTWRNHTDFADRTQDTYTPVAFAGEAPTTTTTTTTGAPTTTTTDAPTTTTSTIDAPSTTTTAPDGRRVITTGSLDWGVKSSFVSYVTGPVAHGTVTPQGGAATDADGSFRFPLQEAELAADDSFVARFGGALHLAGHDGQLDMTISGIEVVVDGDAGVLVADVSSSEPEGAPSALTSAAAVDRTDVPLAVLDLSGVTPVVTDTSGTWAAIAATLTEEGEPAFGGFYAAGTALDPVTVVLGATAVAPGPAGTSPVAAPAAMAATGTLPYTGVGPAPVLRAGIVLVGGGTALALVARRRRALVG